MFTCGTPSPKPGLLLKPPSMPLLKLGDILAEGGFSTVYKARSDHESYIVKRVNLKRPFYRIRARLLKWKSPKPEPRVWYKPEESVKELKEVKKKDIEMEIQIQQEARHKFVLELLDHFKKMKSLWLVTEHCLCNISELGIQKPDLEPSLPIDVVCHLLFPIYEAVAHLNSLGYIHLDIKNENILISKHGVPKLADFGLATKYPGKPVKVLHTNGTPGFMAPEMVRKEFYNYSIDTWSLAVTMLHGVFGPDFLNSLGSRVSPEVFFLGISPDGSFDQDQLDRVFNIPSWRDDTFKRRFGGDKESSLLFLKFIREVQVVNWKERPTCSQASNLPFAQKFLHSWENKEGSTLFQENNECVLELLADFASRIPDEATKKEWSKIESDNKSRIPNFSGLLNCIYYIAP